MKKIKNEFNCNIFYEVDDISSFGEDISLENDFEKLKYKKVGFVNEEFDIVIVELGKKESFYKYKEDDGVLLLVTGKKLYEVNWGGSFLNVLETSVDEYEIEMLDKIRNDDVKHFTIQF